MNDKAFINILCGVDLNSGRHTDMLDGAYNSGGVDVYREDPVCPDYGLSPLEHVSSNRQSLWWRLCFDLALKVSSPILPAAQQRSVFSGRLKPYFFTAS